MPDETADAVVNNERDYARDRLEGCLCRCCSPSSTTAILL